MYEESDAQQRVVQAVFWPAVEIAKAGTVGVDPVHGPIWMMTFKVADHTITVFFYHGMNDPKIHGR